MLGGYEPERRPSDPPDLLVSVPEQGRVVGDCALGNLPLPSCSWRRLQLGWRFGYNEPLGRRQDRGATNGGCAPTLKLRVSSSAKRNLRRCVGSGLVFLRKGLSRFGLPYRCPQTGWVWRTALPI